MKIGITLQNSSGMESEVCEHLGQCEYFMIAEIKDGKLIESNIYENTAKHGGGGCQSVDELLKHGVSSVISGGMGARAQQKFMEKNVNVFGFSGNVADAIKCFIQNALSDIEPCSHHEHHGECHNNNEYFT